MLTNLTCHARTGKITPVLSEEGTQVIENAQDSGDRCRSMALIFQEFLDFKRGHATGTGGSYSLPVSPVLHIAASINAGYLREHVTRGLQIAVLIGIQLAFEDFGVGNVSDSEEHGTGGEVSSLPVLNITLFQAGHFLFGDVVHIFHHSIG